MDGGIFGAFSPAGRNRRMRGTGCDRADEPLQLNLPVSPTLSPPQIGDLLVLIATLVTQIIIGWLYFRDWRRKMPRLAARLSFVVLSILGSITAFNSLSMLTRYRGRNLPGAVRGIIEAVGLTWGVGSLASLCIYFVFRYLARQLPAEFSTERRGLIRAAGATAMAAPFAFAAYGGFVERTRFEVREIDLPVPNLHPDLEGIRIAQISDLHVSPFLSVREAARVVDMTNEQRPHLTMVTGDLISERGDPLDETIRELARLRAEAGVLGCMGNHEYYARCQNYTEHETAKVGITFLRNQARQFRWGQGVLNVGGVDFQATKDKHKYLSHSASLVVRDAERTVTNLLLSHNPDVFPVAVKQGWDAVLSGHTHGGQVTMEILNRGINPARFVTPFVAGLYRIDGRSCYVNAGIGTIGMPVRLGAPPEISLFRLKRA